MEKTYRVLDNPLSMSASEIRRAYDGYWVFMVCAEFDEHMKLLKGTPVIVGSRAYDGAEDGIYDPFQANEFERVADLSLLPDSGFISALRIPGEPIG